MKLKKKKKDTLGELAHAYIEDNHTVRNQNAATEAVDDIVLCKRLEMQISRGNKIT